MTSSWQNSSHGVSVAAVILAAILLWRGSMDEELDRFKQLDLRQYAASIGYTVDRRASSAGNTVMRRDHDKIIISRKPDGHYTYWSPRDEHHKGTIIDLVGRLKGLNLGGIRKELRAWMGEPGSALPFGPALSKTVKDVEAVRRRYASMLVADRHSYLEVERCIPSQLLQHPRWAGRIRVDRYGAAVFAHVGADDKICGYELKNRGGFTGFASGGRKGIFISNRFAEDRRLVVTESGIDALSYSALFGDLQIARYASIGGKPTPAQRAIVRAAMVDMPRGSEIVAATDADQSGADLANELRQIFDDCARADLSFRREVPEGGAKDWNVILQRRARGYAPSQLSGPRPA
jgi:Protein of unknown function (DUF3991)/Toprim-like